MEYKEGSKYKNFIITKYLPIEEIQNTLIELTHEPTGAKVIHLSNKDEENVFSLSFRTYPDSSNGAPHILEHTVLCGSKKFPVKDPFFSMLRRSLNTFMNAMTGSDFTCYPASSQVEKDFYNLMEVYLDAVFHPELKETSFMQEGHRFAFAEEDNPASPLLIKGVVYNEMKGAMASADSRLFEAIGKYLLPDLTYAHNSGGEPNDIANLTYEGLKKFHQTFYHPSQCLFFFYGNLPLESHLDFIEKNALKEVEKRPQIEPIKKQKRFTSPKNYHIPYPIAENESLDKKDILAFSYLTCSILDQEEALALSVLDSILMDTDASLLKLAILQSGLCSQVDSFLDTEISELPWVFVCRGCEKKDQSALQKIIKTTLEKIVKEKIPQPLIDAALHQLEFSRLEIVRDNAPYGLTLFMRSALLKQHGCETESALKIHSLFKCLSEKLKDPNYLTGLIEKYLLKNTHLVNLVMEPDPTLQTKEQKLEREMLDEIQSKLTKEKKTQIIQKTKELKNYQKQVEKQSLDCLPKVTLQDVPKKVRDFPIKEIKSNHLHVYHHNCFTNEVLYVDLFCDLSDLKEDELIDASIFSSLLTDMGCANRDYKENLQYMHAYTGGIDASLSLHTFSENPKKYHPSFCLGGKSLYRNSDKLFSLMKETLISTKWRDPQRIKECLLQEHAYLQSSIISKSLDYAVSLSMSGMDTSSYIDQKWHGLAYFRAIEHLVKNIDTEVPLLIQRLENLQNKIISLHNIDLVIGADQKHFDYLAKNQFWQIDELSSNEFIPWQGNYQIPSISSHARMIPSPVAFTSMAFDTIGYEQEQSPALLVSTKLMENTTLHKKIREQGGAYGSGARYFPLKGKFHFFGYRDPHLLSTIEAFYFAVDEIVQGKFSDQQLEEAKLGIIQSLDKPISPGSRAISAYFWKRSYLTKEKRQTFRDRLLNSSREQIQKALQDQVEKNLDKSTLITFTNPEMVARENKLLEEKKHPILEALPLL